MSWSELLFLSVLQGITEFLPVSSSGHLVVAQELFKQFGHGLPEKETLTLDVMLHLGTLLSILVYFHRRLWRILVEWDWRLVSLLVVASVPAGIAGFTLKKQFEAMFENPLAVGMLFPVTGAMLLWASRCPAGDGTMDRLTYGRALIVGLFQAFAILPGVSRSGSTITAGIGVKLRRDEAATFSFLLAIPAIAGAALLEGHSRIKSLPDPKFCLMLAIGAAVSFVVGLAALAWLFRWLEKGRLQVFAWWVILLGLAVIAWQLRFYQPGG